MRVDRFEDLVAWQKARVLTKGVYLATMSNRFERDFALCGQIRKSAISVPSNIAEGFERGGRREFHQFLSIAKGSCAELRAQLYIAADIGYIDEPTAKTLLNAAEEVARIVGGLRKAVANQRTQSSVLSPQS
jgi:four helix bundle protein